MRIAVLLPLWRAWLESDHADRTVRSYTEHMGSFARSLGNDAEISAITTAAIEGWKRGISSRCGPKTIGLALTSVRSFCRFLIASDLRSDDPTLKVRFPKAAKTLPRALSSDQVRELLAALAVPADLPPALDYHWRRNRLCVLLMLYTGSRNDETRRLRWRDVDLDRQRIVIRSGKGEKDRSVPLHPRLLGDLRLASDGRRPNDAVCGHAHGPMLAEKSLHHIFERWIPKLGLSFTFTAHQLRHTFITALIDHGANVFEAQELAGHDSPETTRIYYRLSAEHLRAAVNRLPTHW